MHCAYRFQLKPNRTQLRDLERMGHARRFAYNWGLERWQTFYREHGSTISLRVLLRELTGLKREPDHLWLRSVDSQLLQQAIFDVRQAYRNFFERRADYPRFKSRRTDPLRFRIPQRVRVEGNRVYVPKIGWVRARVSREVPPDVRSATFKRDSTGKWYASLVADVRPTPVVKEPRRLVGVDVGVVEFAVLSTGERIANPRFARAALRRIRRAHRRLSRKRRGSRHRSRARAALAREYRRGANRRRDFLHKLSTRLVREWDLIAVEDLGVCGLARTKLAAAVGDSAFYEFRRQLDYKCAWRGKRLYVANRFFPSSRMCSSCGTINRVLSRRTRTWRCTCGAVHDRDLNAAKNLRAAAIRGLVAVGRTDTKNARGARVGPPMGTASREAGIQLP